MNPRRVLAVAALPLLTTGLMLLPSTAGASGSAAVASSPATSVTSSSATLNGSITPNGSPTTYEFEYGTTSAYGTTIPSTPVSAGKGTTAVLVSLSLGGLEPGTTYHYQLVGNSLGATISGGDETFRTKAVAPAVVTGRASSIKASIANVWGSVTPGGARTKYYVQYYSVKGTVLTTRSRSAGGGNRQKSVTVHLGQLTSSTIYHYRVVAKDSAGTTRGRWRTFRTRTGTVEATFTG